MEITLNGEKENLADSSLTRLINELELPVESLVVELNREIIKRDKWESVELKEGDELELLNFVSGG